MRELRRTTEVEGRVKAKTTSRNPARPGARRVETDSGATEWRPAGRPSATVGQSGCWTGSQPTHLTILTYLETSLIVFSTGPRIPAAPEGNTGKEHKMDCVNHSGISATAYCQNCGKALCAGCVRNAAGGQLLCEPCLTAWQSYQQPFVSRLRQRTQPRCGRGAGTHSRRGRHVQRPVLQRFHPRGRSSRCWSASADHYRNLRPLHRRLDSLPVV